MSFYCTHSFIFFFFPFVLFAERRRRTVQRNARTKTTRGRDETRRILKKKKKKRSRRTANGADETKKKRPLPSPESQRRDDSRNVPDRFGRRPARGGSSLAPVAVVVATARPRTDRRSLAIAAAVDFVVVVATCPVARWLSSSSFCSSLSFSSSSSSSSSFTRSSSS